MMQTHDLVRALVLEHGYNATSYQILNPGFQYWFNADRTAVVAYAEHHGVRVVAGVPVCAEGKLVDTAAAFEADSARKGLDVAYFAVEQRSALLWKDVTADHSAIVIGAQPVWEPAALVEAMRGHSSLRAQLNRATNKGVRIDEWTCDEAEHSATLRHVLDEWLERRGLPPLRFLVEPNTLPSLLDRHIFVASRDAKPVGFLVAAPIPRRNGWLIEQNVRANAAPNGTAEALLFAAAVWMQEHDASLITLGLSPLSQHAPSSDTPPPRAIRALFTWLRAHGRRFYNFEGLDTFKAKFRPQTWEPVYAVVQPDHSLRALVAIGAAFGGTSVIPFVLRVVRHALTQELLRVRRRI